MGFRGNKFRATRVTLDGIRFDSKAEAAHYNWIKQREKLGEVRLVTVHDKVYLSKARILYKPDFKLWDMKKSKNVWEETKGFQTPEWRLKRKMWIYFGPGLLNVYRLTKGRLELLESIPGGEEACCES